MTYRASRRSTLALTGLAGMELTAQTAFAQAAKAAPRAGVTQFVAGTATVADADGKRPLANGDIVREGQALETGPASEIHVVFDDGGYLALRPSSRLQITKAKIAGDFSDSLAMTLFAGAMRSITGWIGKFDHQNYQLSAGTATVGIRGTDHEVANIAEGEAHNGEEAGIHNWVNTGATTLKNAGGSIDVEPSHAAWAGHNGQAPRAHIGGIPAYLKQRQTRNEGRVERHAQHITEHIEKRMQKRGFLKPGEKLADAQARHRLQSGGQEAHAAQKPARAATLFNRRRPPVEKETRETRLKQRRKLP